MNPAIKAGTLEIWLSSVSKNQTVDPKLWSAGPPAMGWCYQEDKLSPGPDQFSVNCHWSRERCETAKGPEGDRRKTPCTFVDDLGSADWKPGRGYMGSWFQYSPAPMPAPFPPLPAAE
jgi:hypothetical protein